MSFSLISNAVAATSQSSSSNAAGGLSSILLLIGFVVIFYFLLWRPQSKRAKEQQQLVANLAKNDEVITSGGILGKITKVSDQFVVLMIAENVEITVQKQSVISSVPKGTMNTL